MADKFEDMEVRCEKASGCELKACVHRRNHRCGPKCGNGCTQEITCGAKCFPVESICPTCRISEWCMRDERNSKIVQSCAGYTPKSCDDYTSPCKGAETVSMENGTLLSFKEVCLNVVNNHPMDCRLRTASGKEKNKWEPFCDIVRVDVMKWDYRVRVIPKIIPWTFTTAPNIGNVIRKRGKGDYLIIGREPEGLILGGDTEVTRWERLLSTDYSYNGAMCGTVAS